MTKVKNGLILFTRCLSMKKDTTGHSFEAFFKRATSPLAVLSLLSERPMYGYEITQELSRRSGGRYVLSLLYPVLYRLLEQGYIARTGRR